MIKNNNRQEGFLKKKKMQTQEEMMANLMRNPALLQQMLKTAQAQQQQAEAPVVYKETEVQRLARENAELRARLATPNSNHGGVVVDSEVDQMRKLIAALTAAEQTKKTGKKEQVVVDAHGRRHKVVERRPDCTWLCQNNEICSREQCEKSKLFCTQHLNAHLDGKAQGPKSNAKNPKCAGVTKSGKKCNSYAMDNCDFCVNHN